LRLQRISGGHIYIGSSAQKNHGGVGKNWENSAPLFSPNAGKGPFFRKKKRGAQAQTAPRREKQGAKTPRWQALRISVHLAKAI